MPFLICIVATAWTNPTWTASIRPRTLVAAPRCSCRARRPGQLRPCPAWSASWRPRSSSARLPAWTPPTLSAVMSSEWDPTLPYLTPPCNAQVAAMEQLQREKAEAAAAVRRLEGELADAVRDREVARMHAADLESRLADMERLRGERAAAVASVQRLEVEAAAAAASLAAATSQVAALENKVGPCVCFTAVMFYVSNYHLA